MHDKVIILHGHIKLDFKLTLLDNAIQIDLKKSSYILYIIYKKQTIKIS